MGLLPSAFLSWNRTGALNKNGTDADTPLDMLYLSMDSIRRGNFSRLPLYSGICPGKEFLNFFQLLPVTNLPHGSDNL